MVLNRYARTLLVTVACFGLLSSGAMAQAPSSGDRPVLEELIVTARKREQNLQDVPMGVSLLSGKAVSEAQLKNAAELATLLPTLNVQSSSGPTTSSFNIRGIGTQTFSPGVDPSVSAMLDGVVLGRSGMAFLELVDVERVEVLRGPQGTLYGKNASGGVVHIITRDPTPELTGTVAATAIENDEYRLDGTVSGPLTESLGYRLTGSRVDDDGWAKNAYNGDKVNDTDSYTLRGKLLWQPTEALDLLLAADYSRNECDCIALSVRSILEGPRQEELLSYQGPVQPGNDQQDVNNDQDTYNDNTSKGVSMNADWEVGDHRLTSITAYREWENESIVDFDRGDTNPLTLAFPSLPRTEQDQFSQELRVASPTRDWGSYVVGLYYFEQDIDNGNTTSTNFFERVTRVSSTDVEGKNAAAFGEVNFNLWQDWQLILGGRYTYDELDYETTADRTDNIVFPPPGEAKDSLDETDFSPKVALQWDITDNAMAYASYVSGYKGPAFDTSLIAEGRVVRPETSDAFEVGLKSNWLDSRLFLNIAIFYAEYDDYQAETSLDENPDDLRPGSPVLINAGEVSTKGVEIEFLAQPLDNWSLSGGFAYTDGTIEDYKEGNCSGGQIARGECPGGTQDLSGGRLPQTPKWKLNLATDYTIELERAPFDLILGANLRAQDDVLYGLSQDPYTQQDDYAVIDLRTVLVGRDRGYRVTAFVKNVTDKNYASLIFANSADIQPNAYIQLVPKYAERTAGIELRYDF
jgi:iron complex outermembrane receptor protein